MAKPKPKGRKRNIPDDQFKKMSPFERAEGMRQAGIKRGTRRAGRGAGRILHAERVPSRASEAKGVREGVGGYVRKFNDPEFIMREGKKEIESHNRRALTKYQAKGKKVLIEGGDARMKDLRKLLQETLDDFIAKQGRKVSTAARVAAKRAAKRLK